ncbi:transglycosylase domain-containing protein [Dialister succinatiphilus]|uniref:transglycosylase domain-containing protein n=1 Tax=Dialister succinatiphilus TaxID=487173 RepID=UPI0023533770|nr:biosynthetic peptidoglycan transglycosylase [Dialister succinatiphilus]MCI6030124.1 transglycosylase domain-containing protein [Dialister succinatiphilus]
MKKFLFLLIILGCAVYWGMSQGDDLSRQAKASHGGAVSAQPVKPAKEEKGIIAEVKDTVSTLISGMSSSPTAQGAVEKQAKPSPASPSTVVKEKAEAGTLREKWNDVSHFKESLESRVHREKFVPYDKIPDLLKKGIIATEDRRYYDHGAVDIIGVARAFITNSMAGETLEGGSTIAQQTVKNIFLSNDRTMTRKLEELALAVQLERNYSKEEILELYLNTIYFGHGTYGVGEASRVYFGKEPKDLDLSQCAMLAGLPQAPSAYDPISHPQEGAKRMTTVLALMAQEGYITPEEAAKSAMHLWLK